MFVEACEALVKHRNGHVVGAISFYPGEQLHLSLAQGRKFQDIPAPWSWDINECSGGLFWIMAEWLGTLTFLRWLNREAMLRTFCIEQGDKTVHYRWGTAEQETLFISTSLVNTSNSVWPMVCRPPGGLEHASSKPPVKKPYSKHQEASQAKEHSFNFNQFCPKLTWVSHCSVSWVSITVRKLLISAVLRYWRNSGTYSQRQ